MENNIKQYRRTLKDYSVAVIFFMFLDIIDMLQSYTNGEYDIHSLGGNRSAVIAVCISVSVSLFTVITKLLIGIFGIKQVKGKDFYLHTVLALISLVFSLFGIFMTAANALKGGYFDVYTTVQSLAAAAVLFLFIRASKKLRKAEKIG